MVLLLGLPQKTLYHLEKAYSKYTTFFLHLGNVGRHNHPLLRPLIGLCMLPPSQTGL
jgi:hypothetical protein